MASADDGGHHALVARTSLGYRQVHDGADPGGTSEMALSAMPRATGHGLGSTDEMLQVLLGLDKPVVRHSQTNLGPLVNWRGGGGLPIHRWFRYREGFSPALIGELGLGVRILDPFCGSGSIMVGSAQQSRSAVGIDVNPLAAFVASVKLTPLKDRDLKTAANFGDRFEGEMEHVEPWPAPGLRIADKVFEPDVLEAVLRLRALIERRCEGNRRVRDFLFLAWLSILQDVGSYFKEGNGIKYRNRKRLRTGYVARLDGQWQEERFGADQCAFVRATYKAKLVEMLADVHAWRSGDWASQRVIEGNSLEEAERLDAESFDSVIFSPPYANRFDYFESQKVELWFGDFVRTYEDMIALRKRSVRSHLGAALNGDIAPLPEIDALIDLIDPDSYAVRMRVPALIRGYFSDMARILQRCRQLLKGDGSCFVVVGNSAYGGVIIPTDAIIAHLARRAGFDHADVIPVRHLTVAPQQRLELRGREEFMRESIVVMS
jgi:DNA modification methylase